ncbi:VWA domain-containing protein [Rhodopirellula sp.]|nr:VWA domain-containing protein [Rhodopirellula sp.]MDB4678868.1 VWA domain-containing protein [Rhodopirellula sp.]
MSANVIAQMTSSDTEIVYEFARLQTLEGWWMWALLVIGSLFAFSMVIRFYRRDAAELSKPVRRLLICLRCVSVLSLLFIFSDLQRRSQRTLTLPSEVAVLVDTSQSMSLPAGSTGASPSRSDRVTEMVGDSDLVAELSQEHRLSVYAFGEESEPRLIRTTDEISDETDPGSIGTDRSQDVSADQDESTFGVTEPPSPLARFGAGLIGLGAFLSVLSFVIGLFGRGASVGWWLVWSAVNLIAGTLVLGAVYAVETDRSLNALILGEVETGSSENMNPNGTDPLVEPPVGAAVDWSLELAASAPQSRIGDAISTVLTSHDPATLAGVIVLTDGQSNGGSDVNAALSAARRNEVSLFPIGLGSGDPPLNVRVVDLDVPKRVYPGDKFSVTATLQASGPQSVRLDVELLDGLDRAADEKIDSQGQVIAPRDVIETQTVEVPVDGTLFPVRFEMEPDSVGRRRLAIRLLTSSEDQNSLDDLRGARYEVVAKKLRVLAVAGGPTREYRFVRNLYYRDSSIDLDVWLQTGQPGMSQDANRVLDGFPKDAQSLFEYDVIAMFDPDWTALNLQQLDLLDQWVSQQAGGLILVPGPVFHPQWTRLRTDPRVAKIAGFFPVSLSTRGAVIASGRQGGENAWPLDLTDEAGRAEFLWLDGDAESSLELWQEFDGVYDYIDTKDAKPGSKVYAYFSDPTTETGGSLPVYMASQFYGAGRTYFQASGEMWRLRGGGDRYFQSYFTKLARWVSEGRLLRDSTRGVLLLDSSKVMVGDSVAVRAVLSDEQFEPLDVPQLDANLLTPDGRIEVLKLLPLQGEPRPGTYGGQFVVREAGSHEVRLSFGDALNEQLLRQSVQVRLPTQELERPQRNDELLERLAKMTAGQYLAVDPSTTNQSVVDSLLERIVPQPQVSILPGSPDQLFSLRRNAVLMWLFAGLLSMEWIVRRLHRLA